MNKNKIPETSIEAFNSLRSEDMIKTYNNILYSLSILKEATYEEMASFLKCEPGKIWRRLSELHEKYHLIYRPGNKRKLKSNRPSYTWKLSNPDMENIVVTERFPKGKASHEYAKDLFTQQALF